MMFRSEEFDLPLPAKAGTRPEKRNWPAIAGVAAIAFVVLLAMFMAGNVGMRGAPPAATSAAVAPAAPVAGANGVVDSGGKWHTVEYALSLIDDSTAEQDYRYLLDALSAKFPGVTRHHLGDYLIHGQELLREKGIRESLSEFGWHVDECVPREMAGTMTFPKVAALYLTLKTNGR